MFHRITDFCRKTISANLCNDPSSNQVSLVLGAFGLGSVNIKISRYGSEEEKLYHVRRISTNSFSILSGLMNEILPNKFKIGKVVRPIIIWTVY